MAIGTEEPILSQLDRLDNILRQLEEIRGCSRSSPKSSSASSPSSGTLTSEGQPSSLDFSPKSLEKLCRPLDRVIMETELKGILLQRLDHFEDRLLKLCVQMEEEVEAEKQRGETDKSPEKPYKKAGIKSLVERVVNPKHHSKHKPRTD